MYYIGIDLGGTEIKAGVVTEDLKIISKDSVPTGPKREASEIIRDMASVAISACDIASVSIDDVVSVGIGSPGTCDNKNGVLVYTNNINFLNTPMRAEMQKYISKPVYIENDANCAALGEYKVVSNTGVKDMIMITLGTGLGGGIIIDGKLYPGFNGAGAELGHTALISGGYPCTCGRNGCLEAYASVTGLIRMTKELLESNPQSGLAKYVDGDVTGKTAFVAARAGDVDGLSIVDKWCEYIGEGVLDFINIFSPELLVIGGAVAKEGDFLLSRIVSHVNKYVYCRTNEQTQIRLATLGNDAGLIGAALLTSR